MKNAGLVSPDTVDFNRTKSIMLVSQRVGKDLWRQVFRVTFSLKAGGKIEAIVINEASADECSMSAPQIYVVSKVF